MPNPCAYSHPQSLTNHLRKQFGPFPHFCHLQHYPADFTSPISHPSLQYLPLSRVQMLSFVSPLPCLRNKTQDEMCCPQQFHFPADQMRQRKQLPQSTAGTDRQTSASERVIYLFLVQIMVAYNCAQ